MKSTDVKATIRLAPKQKVLAICLAMLDDLYIDTAKRTIRALAACYGMTCS